MHNVRRQYADHKTINCWTFLSLIKKWHHTCLIVERKSMKIVSIDANQEYSLLYKFNVGAFWLQGILSEHRSRSQFKITSPWVYPRHHFYGIKSTSPHSVYGIEEHCMIYHCSKHNQVNVRPVLIICRKKKG